MPPPVPVTVIVVLPSVALAAAVTVMVDVPDPGAAMLVGAKTTVTPLGIPVAESATAELNPPRIALVIVDGPELPCATVSDVGFADNEKSGVATPPQLLTRFAASTDPRPVTKS